MPTPFECKDRGICNRLQPEAVRDAAIQPPARPTAQDKAIIDEAILRGASVDEVMDLLFARALPRTDIGRPAYLMVPGVNARIQADRGLWSTGIPEGRIPYQSSETAPGRVLRKYAESLVVRTPREAQGPLALAPARIREVEALLPFVVGRYNAYVEMANQEFNALSHFVRESFAPLRDPPHVDSYRTPGEKYRAMRAAYYRAGWPFIKRDILDLIDSTFFFGVRLGGVHVELRNVLRDVEKSIRKDHVGVANDIDAKAAGFVIHSFVPRLIEGSNDLSYHAYGLAIDIDPVWNPQVKTKTAAAAFKRATGEDWNQLFVKPVSSHHIRKLNARVAAASKKLQAWLNEWLPKYHLLLDDRKRLANDKKQKAAVAALDREIRDNPDLKALHTLMTEYKPSTVEQWRTYGIITIAPEIIERFVGFGVRNKARWGGEYEGTKDIMHLELRQVVAKTTRRAPVSSMTDLYHPDAHPAPVNGPR
jgi:hypothetical protein